LLGDEQALRRSGGFRFDGSWHTPDVDGLVAGAADLRSIGAQRCNEASI
jgi:hypothetical protein